MLLGTWPTTVSIQVDPISRNENLQRVANIKRSKKLMGKKKKKPKNLKILDPQILSYQEEEVLHYRLPNMMSGPVCRPYFGKRLPMPQEHLLLT